MKDMREKYPELQTLADGVLERLHQAGAEEAKVVASTGRDLSVRVRLGEVERVEEAATRSLAVRVRKNGCVARASTSDTTPDGINRLVNDAMELCALSQPDPFAALPEKELLYKNAPDLDLFDPNCDTVTAEQAIARAKRAEDSARKFDPRITNSEGANFGRSSGAYAVAASNGFRGGYARSYASLSVEPVADDEGGKKRTASYWTANRYLSKLENEEEIGREAARRTLRLLGARKVPTCSVPVVFERDAARSLLGSLAGCLVGDSIYKRSSYLVGRVGTKIASDIVNIIDHPLIPGAPGSRPFDGDGLGSRKNVVVENGELKTYLLDVYSARKLGLTSTASASSLLSNGAGTTNFILQPGEQTPEQIIGGVSKGLYVTGMMGFGFNPVTGDFSRAALGFWIEDGKLAYPVSEITISLNFDGLWQRIDAIGNDSDDRSSVVTSTIRVSEMTVAGS